MLTRMKRPRLLMKRMNKIKRCKKKIKAQGKNINITSLTRIS